MMGTENTDILRIQRFWFFWLPLIAVATLFFSLTIWAGLLLAQTPAQPTYASAQEASHALFEAVQNDNDGAILRILGGLKELTTSGDELEDKVEREQFAAKYSEMHRLVRRADGSMVLFIGAENWPFPIPLLSKNGRWFFDTEAGTQEALFRRVGENEVTAIETCRSLADTRKEATSEATRDDEILHYAHQLVDAQASGISPVSPGDARHQQSFHGYYFRPLTRAGRESRGSRTSKAKPVLIAYPAEYRSSGVMSFVVTSTGTVYEKDLGANTANLAQTLATWRPDSSWHVVE